MARFAVVTSFLRPRGWAHAAAEGTADLVAPRWRIAWPCWSPLWQWLGGWTETDATCFLLSAVIHMTVFVVLALVPMQAVRPKSGQGAPEFIPPEIVVDDRPEVIHLSFQDTAVEQPGDLSDRALSHPEEFGSPREFHDDSSEFEAAGGGRQPTTAGAPYDGLGHPDVWGIGPGPLLHGRDGVGRGLGEGMMPGAGGSGYGFGQRGKGSSLGSGGSRRAEIAVVAALDWLYRHQGTAGNWSLTQFRSHCRSNQRCSGPGLTFNDAAGTALGLLPFLAAGQTHREKCTYQATVNRAVTWLVKHQQGDGDLSGGREQIMYSHALAAIALCEAYAMTKDEALRGPAQAAVNFIEMAQNPSTGAWRYTPGTESGDTSVVGWQVMALKSAQMAGLGVDTGRLELVRKWLQAVAKGHYSGLFAYQPFREPRPSMTAVGLLCHQYLGAGRDERFMHEGVDYMLNNLPDANDRDIYYWYYATQVMHNLMDANWDRWNRQVRRVLIETQCRDGSCATGSWDPQHPSIDSYGFKGGRLFETSLSTLTLEIYYRYLSLYKIPHDPLFQEKDRHDGGPGFKDHRPAGPGFQDSDPDDSKPVVRQPKPPPPKRGIWSLD
jgi:hypothetical protein